MHPSNKKTRNRSAGCRWVPRCSRGSGCGVESTGQAPSAFPLSARQFEFCFEVSRFNRIKNVTLQRRTDIQHFGSNLAMVGNNLNRNREKHSVRFIAIRFSIGRGNNYKETAVHRRSLSGFGGFGINATGNPVDVGLTYFPESSRRNRLGDNLTQSTGARDSGNRQRNRAPRGSSEKITKHPPRVVVPARLRLGHSETRKNHPGRIANR